METALAHPLSVGDSDAPLVRRMAAGDEKALCHLYARYGRRLFAYAVRLTGSSALAEEVLQDSLLAAWNSAGKFRGDARVIVWLLGIVRHKALNAVRRRRLPTTTIEQASETVDGASTPDDEVEAADRRYAVKAALSHLSVEHRTVLELVFYQGLSLAEVATVSECPLGTVKSRLSYAKARLRDALNSAGLRAEDLL